MQTREFHFKTLSQVIMKFPRAKSEELWGKFITHDIDTASTQLFASNAKQEALTIDTFEKLNYKFETIDLTDSTLNHKLEDFISIFPETFEKLNHNIKKNLSLKPYHLPLDEKMAEAEISASQSVYNKEGYIFKPNSLALTCYQDFSTEQMQILKKNFTQHLKSQPHVMKIAYGLLSDITELEEKDESYQLEIIKILFNQLNTANEFILIPLTNTLVEATHKYPQHKIFIIDNLQQFIFEKDKYTFSIADALSNFLSEMKEPQIEKIIERLIIKFKEGVKNDYIGQGAKIFLKYAEYMSETHCKEILNTLYETFDTPYDFGENNRLHLRMTSAKILTKLFSSQYFIKYIATLTPVVTRLLSELKSCPVQDREAIVYLKPDMMMIQDVARAMSLLFPAMPAELVSQSVKSYLECYADSCSSSREMLLASLSEAAPYFADDATKNQVIHLLLTDSEREQKGDACKLIPEILGNIKAIANITPVIQLLKKLINSKSNDALRASLEAFANLASQIPNNNKTEILQAITTVLLTTKHLFKIFNQGDAAKAISAIAGKDTCYANFIDQALQYLMKQTNYYCQKSINTVRGPQQHDGDLFDADMTVKVLLSLQPSFNAKQNELLLNFLVNHLSSPLAVSCINALDKIMLTIDDQQLLTLQTTGQRFIKNERVIETAANMLERFTHGATQEKSLRIINTLINLLVHTVDNGIARDGVKNAIVKAMFQLDPQHKHTATYGQLFSAAMNQTDMSVRLALMDAIGQVHYPQQKQFILARSTMEQTVTPTYS